ncbi:hypothetical protein ULF88_24890 [Halopseudomonas pachastrellae]|nr:hypothetical protein [Halopseudomonas pachastrellae]
MLSLSIVVNADTSRRFRSLPILALLSMLLWAGHALAGYKDGNGQGAQATYDNHPHNHDDLNSQSLQPGGTTSTHRWSQTICMKPLI